MNQEWKNSLAKDLHSNKKIQIKYSKNKDD